MNIASTVLIASVALLHVFFLVLEMFLYTKPFGRKVFRVSLEKANDSKVLAANQGLYNGFLAAGLIWSVISSDGAAGKSLAIFFLTCVIVAALYGAYSVNKRIFFIQGLPAVLALMSLFFL